MLEYLCLCFQTMREDCLHFTFGIEKEVMRQTKIVGIQQKLDGYLYDIFWQFCSETFSTKKTMEKQCPILILQAT